MQKLVGEEGYEQDQAAAICYKDWEEKLSYDTSNLPAYTDETSKKPKKMVFAAEDKQIIVSPVAIPDQEIIRYDEDTKEEYWVRFSADVIQRMSEKFMREKLVDKTNIEHDQKERAGSYVFESWIVEGENDKANSVYGLDVPEGTWVVKMRVQDPAVWAKVKAGEVKGLSLEGNFIDKRELEEVEEDKNLYKRILEILKGV
jgi:hypothetical protein